MAVTGPDSKLLAPRADRFVIADEAGLRACADQLRLRILNALLQGPLTAKEMARHLDVPQTRLYYHLKILERAGAVRVASRRLVSGIEEQTWEAAAASYTLAPELVRDAVRAGLLKALFELVRAELEVALSETHRTAPPGEPGSTVSVLTLTEVWLDDGEIRSFVNELEALVERFRRSPKAKGDRHYRALFAMYRPSRGDCAT